ncbi:MAG: hypothetical protein Q9227_004794 [Pyrenula ochraceoflavens]
MAFTFPPGLIPSEVAFLCEMTLVTIEPRQRLDRIDLLSGPTPSLVPPQRRNLPLWLALLLKRQRRANVLPPPWLHPDSLSEILSLETEHLSEAFSPGPPFPPSTSSKHHPAPPFLEDCTSTAPATYLPYHWLDLSTLLLEHASDDLVDPDATRRLIRDLREVRMAKMRRRTETLSGSGEGMRMDGVGAMEIAEVRGFVTGVVDGLRGLGRSREEEEKRRREEEGEGGVLEEDEEMEMNL